MFVSCAEQAAGTGGNLASTSTTYRWNSASFPLNLKISDDFLTAEKTVLQAMAESWSSSISNRVTFFTTSQTTSLTTSSISETSTYVDSELGIYKVSNWSVLGLPRSALAVTQLIASTQNAGTTSQFQQIQHADVLINYEHFDHSVSNEAGKYDLGTVAIHEFGHFLGLNHSATTSSSVMKPAITISEVFTEPYTFDANSMVTNYSLNSALSALPSDVFALKTSQFLEDEEISLTSKGNQKLERIIIELHADGECKHSHINTAGQKTHEFSHKHTFSPR